MDPQAHQGHYSPPHSTDYHPREHYPYSCHEDAPVQEDPQRRRSRPSSPVASEGHPSSTQQPLRNALNNAFDKSGSARSVPPELIAQITAEVKRSVLDEIKLNGIGSTNQGPPLQPKPLSTTSLKPRNVYPPPSPKQNSEPLSRDSRDSMFDSTDDTPTPRHERRPVNIPQEITPPRPAPARMITEETYTPIEKMWQRLFDNQGQPTARLGQFLRGLAVHLIEDYEPKNSLVISPAKMLKFYDDVKLDEDIYPWGKIFSKISCSTLSKIYRDMRCQHHLIQEHNADQPYIPALTPDGFQEWMTVMIQAYPSTEYERLSKAVLDMPISNADDRKERFPKELPRRMFPLHENLHAQQRCAAVLSAEGVGPLRRAPTFPPPPPMGHGLERERSPYAGRPTDSGAVESDDEHKEGTSRPIERERNPYSAAPGLGKFHEDGHSHSVPPEMLDKGRRRQSTANQSQWVPPPTTASQTSQNTHTNSQTNGRRPQSPGISNYGKRSDPNVRNAPGGYYPNTPNMNDETKGEKQGFAKDAKTRCDEWAADGEAAHHRRNTLSMDSSYDPQSRSVYDDNHYRTKDASNGYDNRGYESRRY